MLQKRTQQATTRKTTRSNNQAPIAPTHGTIVWPGIVSSYHLVMATLSAAAIISMDPQCPAIVSQQQQRVSISTSTTAAPTAKRNDYAARCGIREHVASRDHLAKTRQQKKPPVSKKKKMKSILNTAAFPHCEESTDAPGPRRARTTRSL